MTTQVLKQTELLGRKFDVYGTPQEPLFLAKEVAEMIEHTNHRVMLQSVDDEEKVVSNVYTLGGQQQTTLLTESGLYEVLMQSRKPIAKQFKKGVKAILRDIRTTGGYIATHYDETPEMIMARALEVAKATIERHQKQLQDAQQQNQALAQENEKLRKDSDYLSIILSSDSSIAITQIAQDYGLSARALNEKLHQMRIQHKVNGQWILYAPHQGKHYIKSRTIDFINSEGVRKTRIHTEWTQRGRIFLYNALSEAGILPLIEQ